MKRSSQRYVIGLGIVSIVLANLLLAAAQVSASSPPPVIIGASEVEPPDIPPGYRIIEGDIQIRKTEFERLVSSQSPNAPQGTYEVNTWTNNLVPFEFNGNFPVISRTWTLNAMTRWQNASSVQFQPRNGEANYVRIQLSTGNNSAVGMQTGLQIINIANWNNEFIIAHELGHALGLEHEHSHPDRDQFVDIQFGNMQSGVADQFTRLTSASTYGSYDFDSVMHYDQCAFSVDCPAGATCACTRRTTLVKEPYTAQWQNAIGQRTHLSTGDQNVMGCMYPRSDWRWVRTSSLLPFGTCRLPYTTIFAGVNNTPSGGTIWIEPGLYTAVGTYAKPMTLRAPNGSVTLQ